MTRHARQLQRSMVSTETIRALWQTRRMTPRILLRALVLAMCCVISASAVAAPPSRVLIFSKTAGFRHDSIPGAVAALSDIARRQSLDADASEDASVFTPDRLRRYRAVVFVNTTGDILDPEQQRVLEAFIRAGGGFMGVHAAADTEYDWPWYGELVGAWFLGHPPGLQTTRVRFGHDGIAARGREWRVTDEIYNYRRNPRGSVAVIATVDEHDYAGGTMGDDHPIAWCHGFEGGRAWYTGLGHDAAMYSDATFLRHLRRGLRYVTGRAETC